MSNKQSIIARLSRVSTRYMLQIGSTTASCPNQTLTNSSRTADGVSLFRLRQERNIPSTLTPLRCIGDTMKPKNNDGASNGQEENSHDGLNLKLSPFLTTQESLPQQIDPEKLYVGLPTGWVDMFDCVGSVEGIPDGHVLMIKNGRELLEMLK